MSLQTLCGAVIATALLMTSGWAAAAELNVLDWRQPLPVTGDVAAGKEKAQVCNNCHGANGKAPIPNFPSVAGLPEGYLYWKLVEFKESLRSDSIMTPLVANNTIEDLADIAVYYASLPLLTSSPLTPAPVDDEVLARGQQLYLAGDAARGVPACQGCHGAEGKGPPGAKSFQANWPPLYGQQAMYVQYRLDNFQRSYAIDTTMDKIMEGVSKNLTPDDIEALAAFVERLDGR